MKEKLMLALRLAVFVVMIVVHLIWLFFAELIQRAMLALGKKDGLHYVIRAYAGFIAWNIRLMFGSVRVQNNCGDTLPSDRPLLLVSNHQSGIDVPMVPWALAKMGLKRRIAYISRPGIDRGILGISIGIANTAFILDSRKAGHQDDQGIKAFAQEAAADGRVPGIFPEGVKSPLTGHELWPFRRSGLTWLLEALPNALILPVAVSGTNQFYVVPRSREQAWQYPPNFGARVRIAALPLIDPQEFESIEATIAHCESVIHAAAAEGGKKLRRGEAPYRATS